MELNELMKSPPALLEELKNTFSARPTLKLSRGVIKAQSKSSIPLSTYEKKGIIKDKQSLKHFIQDKGSGHQEYKDLYEEVKEDETRILGIPEWILRQEGETERRMALAEKYDWSFYSCQSLHARTQPSNKKLDGIINWVRITLVENADTHKKRNIETPLGWVRASDHLAFSKKDLRNYVFTDHYPNGIEKPGVQGRNRVLSPFGHRVKYNL